MNLLAIVSGEYGFRHLENIHKYAPPGWAFNTWRAPVYFPWVIDEPGDHLPVEVQEKANLPHQHYPCLASMVKLDDFDHETLMMESGRQLTQNLRKRT